MDGALSTLDNDPIWSEWFLLLSTILADNLGDLSGRLQTLSNQRMKLSFHDPQMSSNFAGKILLN